MKNTDRRVTVKSTMKPSTAARTKRPGKKQNGGTTGRKDDQDKPRYDLLPPYALEQIVLALNHGSKKYGDDNWRKVPDARRRYFSACMRHLWAWFRGEEKDVESNLSHLAHAGCCIMFLLEASHEKNR